MIAAVALVAGGCGTTKPSRGLAEAPLPWGVLDRPGELGFGDVGFRIKQLQLPSGMRVLLERTPTRGMVGVVLTVAAGSTEDPPGKEGLAHWVEHLSFQAIHEGRRIDELLGRMGASYNATTSLDVTRFHEFAPASELPRLLALAARRLSDPLGGVDQAAAERERRVVENELRQRNHTGVYGAVLGELQRAVFAADHPYARPTIGTPASLAALTLEDARAFARRHYRPGNATLVVVGDFEEEEADLQRVLAAFPPALLERAAAEAPRPFRRAPGQPPAPPGGAQRLEAAVSLPEVWIAWPLPSAFGQSGHFVRMVTAPVLESLLEAVLGDDEDVAAIQVVPIHARQATLLACGVTLWNARRREEIAGNVRDLVETLWRAPPAEVELGGARAAVRTPEADLRRALFEAMSSRAFGQAAFAAEAYQDRALARAEHLAAVGDGGHYTQVIQEMLEAKQADVSAFATRHLARERSRLLMVDPLPPRARPAPGPVRAASDAAIAPDLVAGIADYGPPPRLPPPRELAAARELALDNGMRVALVRRPHFPTVTVALLLRGGRTTAEPPGVLDLIRRVLPPERSSLPLNAVEVGGHDGPAFTADVVKAGRGNLAAALAVLVARLIGADEVDWEAAFARREQQTTYSLRADLPHQKATRAVLGALYGDHPYGRLPTAADHRALTAEAVRAWLGRMHTPHNATLVVVGDVSLDEAEAAARTWFGPWKVESSPSPPAVPAAPAPPAGTARETVIVTHRPGTPQAEVVVACRVPGETPRDHAAATLLAQIAGSHLVTRLRGEAGATYGVSASPAFLGPGAAHLILSFAVDNDRLRDAAQVVRAQWAQLAAGDFDEGAISQSRWSIARAEALAFQTSTETALRIVETLRLGWVLREAGALPDHVRAVTPADLARSFAVCRASTVLSLVGDEPTIRAAL